MKKYLTIGIVLLLIILEIAPSINANTTKDSELVEITTYFSGVDGLQPHKAKLTKDESNQLDLLFEQINQQLKNANSLEEAESIINNAIIQLYKLDLIPENLGVKKAQELATGKILTSNIKNKIIFNRLKLIEETKDANSNKFCYIAGESTEELPVTWFHSLRFRLAYSFAVFLYLLDYLFYIPSAKQAALGWMMMLGFIFGLRLFAIEFPPYSGTRDPFYQWPFMMGGWINYGVEWFTGDFTPSEGWVTTFGLEGLKSWSGNLYGHFESFRDFPFVWEIGAISHVGVSGFFGIMFDYSNPDPDVIYPRKYIGFSLKVKLDNYPLL